MNRRSLLSFLASLPIVGAFVKPAAGDGVALRSISHPCAGALDEAYEPSGVVTAEISLTPYAQWGEQVTCENDHLICEFMVDVYVGQTQNLAAQLGNWTQEPPKIGVIPIPGCAVCGAAFTDGGAFHFKDGWRRPPSPGLRLRR